MMFPSASAKAMTLIELIAVLGLLALVLGLTAAQLGRFFEGRRLQEEVRRFVALTRHARNEAIARSCVMELWVDIDNRAYGLRPQIDVDLVPRDPIHFDLDEGLKILLSDGKSRSQTEEKIVFWPDGSIGENSLSQIWISGDDDQRVLIERISDVESYHAGQEETDAH